jgi:hypothetical protein
MTTVSIHQPSYLVWPPLLEKMARADLFIYLDDVNYSKNSEINRNRILSAQGPLWLTIPTGAEMGTPINEVRLPDGHWATKHWKSILNCYAKAPFFGSEERETLEELYRSPSDELWKVNVAFTSWLRDRIGITTPTILGSSLGITSQSSRRILDLCMAVGAKRYLSGPAGPHYLDIESFERAGIEVLVQDYDHRPYAQQFRLPDFAMWLSAIDMLFNVGPRCLEEILARGQWAPVAATLVT